MGFTIVGIGNAVMDVIAPVTEEMLVHLGVQKGIMQLVERDRSDALLAAQSTLRYVAGGSVANTLAGIGRMGLSTAFIGRVANDALGRAYIEQTEAAGTRFVNPAVQGADLPTSRSVILVTPDGERSMNTYLGISVELDAGDVRAEVFSRDGWLFLEGYLFDKPAGKAAFLQAVRHCHAAGGKAGIALSDPFCVDRHRADFRRLIREDMDYVIGNIHEWTALYQTSDLNDALTQAAAECDTVICTCSGDDAILIRGAEKTTVPVRRIVPVDATGAGDQFAAGLIYGLASGRPLSVAGRMGCLAAAEVISHVGARPEGDVMTIFRAEGLI